jgi:hypothetical protein
MLPLTYSKGRCQIHAPVARKLFLLARVFFFLSVEQIRDMIRASQKVETFREQL